VKQRERTMIVTAPHFAERFGYGKARESPWR
jgi:hypothetical protein